MTWMYINEKEIEKVREPYFIYALGGGMGNLAKIVGKSIIEKYKPKRVGYIVSYAFPDISYSNKKGMLKKLYLIKLYHFVFNENSFLILYGDLQPGIMEDVGVSLKERYDLTIKVLRMLKKLRTRLIVSIGGLGLELEPDSPKVFLSYNKYFDMNILNEKNIEIEVFKNNNIIGMSGLLVSLADFYKIPAFILLAETYNTNQLDGYIGASKIAEYMNKLFGFDLDTQKLYEKGKELRDKVSKYLKETLEKIQKERKLPEYFG